MRRTRRSMFGAATLVAALALAGGPAAAHDGHPLNPLARTTAVTVVADAGARVDLRVAFEIANPTDHVFTIVGAEARGGAQAALISGDGAPLRVPVGANETVRIEPPTGVLVVDGALRRALEGSVGMLVKLPIEGGGGMNMLVRLAPPS